MKKIGLLLLVLSVLNSLEAGDSCSTITSVQAPSLEFGYSVPAPKSLLVQWGQQQIHDVPTVDQEFQHSTGHTVTSLSCLVIAMGTLATVTSVSKCEDVADLLAGKKPSIASKQLQKQKIVRSYTQLKQDQSCGRGKYQHSLHQPSQKTHRTTAKAKPQKPNRQPGKGYGHQNYRENGRCTVKKN